MYLDVLVELTNVFIDKTFTYRNNLGKKIDIGTRVKVPFGSRELEGFVLNVKETLDEKIENIKDVISVVDDFPVLNKELLYLGKYISKTTLSSLMSSYSCMLPKALKAKIDVKINIKYDTYIKLNEEINLKQEKLNDNQIKIIDYLKENKEVLKEKLNIFSQSSINTLIKRGILLKEEKEHYRYNLTKSAKKDFVLNEDQKLVFDEVVKQKNTYNTFLLYGVTGSGKTNVYIEIAKNIIKDGKTAIVLVPEISLTPQMINRFTSAFQDIAVLHSGLSDGEKYDEWRKIKEGKVSVVIGARSAIFAPLENIGVIIIDEEHSSTYKQENVPRYNAIEVAKERCKYNSCPLILGSATPRLESYARALKGVYKLLKLDKRYNNMMLPSVKVIDMNKSFKENNSFFSKELVENIKQAIANKEQVILFLNRRGYSGTVICKNCGEAYKCPNCDITLTYHKTSNMLRCHYCGYATKRDNKCPNCKEEFKDYGIGTEKVEEEIKNLIKDAKIVRMDVDTTTKKNSIEKIIKDFENQKYNILLGTQMISKGLDFPNVTLVGVINADIGLNYPDFRSSEITFELLNQVLGRSGRGVKKGNVIIQTFNPEHYAITYTINHDYNGFFKKEMSIRKSLDYPPYYYICSIKIISKDYNLANDTINETYKFIKNNITDKEIILGPSCCNMFKLNNNYRFQIIIKYKDKDNIMDALEKLQEHYFGNKNIKLEIDFDPYKI